MEGGSWSLSWGCLPHWWYSGPFSTSKTPHGCNKGIRWTASSAVSMYPVFKGGNKTQMNNYRPISTLPILSKVLERVVYNQLSHHLESNNLLPPQQSGFRPAFSTTSLLLKITTNWMKSIDSGCYVGAL